MKHRIPGREIYYEVRDRQKARGTIRKIIEFVALVLFAFLPVDRTCATSSVLM